MEPVDLLINCTIKGAVPEATFVVKLTAGAERRSAGYSLLSCSMLLLPPGPVDFQDSRVRACFGVNVCRWMWKPNLLSRRQSSTSTM